MIRWDWDEGRGGWRLEKGKMVGLYKEKGAGARRKGLGKSLFGEGQMD